MLVAPLRGMDQRWNVKPNSATSIRDMTWNDQDAWERAGGYSRLIHDYTTGGKESVKVLTNTYTNSSAPVSLHWFSNHGGALQYLVYETAGGALRYFNGSTAPQSGQETIRDVEDREISGGSSAPSRTIPTTPWEGTTFCTFSGRLYMVNGFDSPLVFDGKKADRAGFSHAPDVPLIEFSGDKSMIKASSIWGLGYGGADGSKDVPSIDAAYAYKVTFLNERGQESPASVTSGTLSWTNKSHSDIIDPSVTKVRALITVHIPLGPPGTVARRVYRTQDLRDADGKLRDTSYGSNFYYLTEIQDNETKVFLDVRRDTSLGSVLVETSLGAWPYSSNQMASFKGTMFLSTTQNDNLVQYSAPGYPEVMPVDNVIDLSDSSSGSITGLYGMKNALVVFKERGIYLIKGDPQNGFFGQTLTKDVGCTAPRSIREVPGVGLVFLASDGIYLLQGALENTGTPTGIVKISQPIRKLIRKINFSATKNVRSVVYHKDREYWLFVPLIGETRPTLVLKFHYEVGAWSFSENYPCRGAVETEDHRGYLIFASDYSSQTDGPKGLYVYSKGFADKGGDYSIEPKYETANLSLGSAFDNFALMRIQAQIIGYGANNLSLNFTTNRDNTTALESAKTSPQKRVLEDELMPVYGTATWDGGSNYVSVRPIPVRFDISTMHKGPVQEFRCSFESSNRVQLLHYEISARAGASKKMLVLNENYGGTGTR